MIHDNIHAEEALIKGACTLTLLISKLAPTFACSASAAAYRRKYWPTPRHNIQQVQKYEKVSNRISASRMMTVCKALGCRIGDPFKGTEDVSLNSGTEKDPLPSVPRQSNAFIKAGQLLDLIPNKQRAAPHAYRV